MNRMKYMVLYRPARVFDALPVLQFLHLMEADNPFYEKQALS